MLHRCLARGFRRGYHARVIDHYESPRNVGKLDSTDKDVGTGLVGAPVSPSSHWCFLVISSHNVTVKSRGSVPRDFLFGSVIVLEVKCDGVTSPLIPEQACGDVIRLSIRVKNGVVVDSKQLVFGCGSAIAASSYTTEAIIGQTIDDAANISNKQIASALFLPPVKLHVSAPIELCSALSNEFSVLFYSAQC